MDSRLSIERRARRRCATRDGQQPEWDELSSELEERQLLIERRKKRRRASSKKQTGQSAASEKRQRRA